MSQNLRKWTALLCAVLIYYICHEGAHLIYAVALGVFKNLNFFGLGIQVVVQDTALSPQQLGWFCIVGSLATIIIAWFLSGFSRRLSRISYPWIRALLYYTTIVFLFIDPLYLSVFYRWVGGGDMNGIVQGWNFDQRIVVLLYGSILLLNFFLFFKQVYPMYCQSCKNEAPKEN